MCVQMRRVMRKSLSFVRDRLDGVLGFSLRNIAIQKAKKTKSKLPSQKKYQKYMSPSTRVVGEFGIDIIREAGKFINVKSRKYPPFK